jgi:isopentenyldiphosphate isomerase
LVLSESETGCSNVVGERRTFEMMPTSLVVSSKSRANILGLFRATGRNRLACMKPLAENERVDVIDDAGNTIRVVTRREMRENRLPHRCTYILVFNSRGELFIHLRTPIKDVYPSHWDICVGGVLAAGESYDEGAARELKEEIGVDAPLERLFPFAFSDARTVVQGMVYKTIHDGPFVYQPEEVVGGEFATVQSVLERTRQTPFCPDGVEVLKRYLNRGSHGAAP